MEPSPPELCAVSSYQFFGQVDIDADGQLMVALLDVNDREVFRKTLPAS